MTSINRTCQYCGRGGVYPPDGDYDFAHKGCHDQHLIDRADDIKEDRQLPFQPHSWTSWEAAQSMKGKAVSIREGVYAWLVANGPATDKRMQEELGLDGNTQRPRRVELFRDGRIREMGKVKLPSGRSAMTWGAVPALRFERPGSGGP